MLVRFSKMHGLGNDFVVLDAVTQDIKLSAQQVQHIANRYTGVGCDQVLLIEPPARPDIDFNYRIYNADGSEVEQCGNGARCLGKYVQDKRLTGKKSIAVSTCNRVMQIRLVGNNDVRVDMGPPVLEPAQIPLKADQQQAVYSLETRFGTTEFGAVSMGNPHAVIQVDDVDTADVQQIGAAIEVHELFPSRVNVGFMQVVDLHKIRLRVFERGVGETRACGTGACAAVVSGQLRKLLGRRVEVELTGGTLLVEWEGGESPVFMTGEAVKVFDGKIKL